MKWVRQINLNARITMIEIDYDTFKEDCRFYFGNFLKEYGFEESHNNEERYTSVLENKFWQLQLSMLKNFPHIGVSAEFKSPDGEFLKHRLITEILAIDIKQSQDLYKNYFTNEFYEKPVKERYKTEMKYCVDNLAKFYKPFLNGEFTYEDYKNYVEQRK